MPTDVLEEDSARPKRFELSEYDGPQMTRVVFSHPFPCLAEGLAGVAPCIPVDVRQFVSG
jgi:hypothetical protein